MQDSDAVRQEGNIQASLSILAVEAVNSGSHKRVYISDNSNSCYS
jgi:hypothetical protein